MNLIEYVNIFLRDNLRDERPTRRKQIRDEDNSFLIRNNLAW